MQALTRAAECGVKVRLYLDATQLAQHEPTRVFDDLAHTPGVEIRVKRENSAFMHINVYEDNDLIVINDAQAAAKFKDVFDARFASRERLPPQSPSEELCRGDNTQ